MRPILHDKRFPLAAARRVFREGTSRNRQLEGFCFSGPGEEMLPWSRVVTVDCKKWSHFAYRCVNFRLYLHSKSLSIFRYRYHRRDQVGKEMSLEFRERSRMETVHI